MPQTAINLAKGITAIVIMRAGYISETFLNLAISLFVLTVLDLITGVIIASINDEFNKNALYKGIQRKFLYVILTVVAYLFDQMVVTVGAAYGPNHEWLGYISTFIMCTLNITEIISICENIASVGIEVPIFHELLSKILENLNKFFKKKIDGISNDEDMKH